MSKKLCKDTEMHFLIDILSFQWLDFEQCLSFVTKSGPSEVLTQRPIIQHGLVDHMAKLTNTKALLTMEKYFSIHVPRTKEQVLDKRIKKKSTKRVGSDHCLQCLLYGVSQA